MSRDEKAASDAPQATQASPQGATPGQATTADTGPGTPPPVPVVPYSRFEIRLYGDTAGRQFSRLINRDGQPDKFRGSIVIAKAWPDGMGKTQQYPFEIPALAVDDAFAKYDEAREAARAKGDADLEHWHLQLVLQARGPMPPPNARGRGGRKIIQ